MPDVLAALKYVATIESIGSSTRVEGARLSGLRSFQSRDEEEVAAMHK